MYVQTIPPDFLDGGVGFINDGRAATLANILRGLTSTGDVALVDVEAATSANGQLGGRVRVGGLPYRWDAASLINDASKLVAIRPTEIATNEPGRFVVDALIADLPMPITFATANDAVLFTVPIGIVLQPLEFWWNVTTNWTGGTASAIGVSSSKVGYDIAGDLLGGATGNIAADLTTALSPTLGTIGAGFDTLAKRRVMLKAGDTIRHNRITSAFTAGAGAVAMRAAIQYT